MLVVVLYHAGLAHVSGGFIGVDVFFVISGFLITRLLVDSVGLRGLRALPTFYTRRIRRLLPAAATVVIATVVAARLWAPPLQVRSITIDGIFTTFYGLNYRLAIEGTQYLHQNDAASPLQHFWSLGVEEQFYVLWPVLIVLGTLIGRRSHKAVLFVALSAMAIISFRYSVTVTKSSASWAYFSLHTRAWELALGGLVALAAGLLARIPRMLAEPAAWAGLIVVIGSAFWFSNRTSYPGSAASVPVVAAAVLIACGCGPRRGVERVLAEPLLQCIGRISYSWYLWHWPMLILVPMIVGHPLNWLGRLFIVWLSLVTSIATFFAVEDPGRRIGRANWQWFLGGGAISGAVLCAGGLVLAHLPSVVGSGAAASLAHANTSTPAVVTQMKRAIVAGVKLEAAPRNLAPTPDKAATDRPAADNTNCHAEFATVKQGPCVYGDVAGRHTAVLLGDSHADVWLPAFSQAALIKHWKVIDWTKSACPAANITVFNSSLNRSYTECDTWRKDVVARIGALRPDLVFISDAENVVDSSVSPQQWSQDTLDTLRAVRDRSGATVELLQDVPVPAYDMPSCVAQHLNSVSECTFPVSKAYSFPSRHQTLAEDAKNAGYPVIDPLPWICTSDRCPAIVGNLLVYRDDTHLTATFSKWLAPYVMPLLVRGK